MVLMDDAPWTLTELAEEVAAVLRGYEAAANGQVRAVPDERSIRYYTTLGLLDRPAAMRGRTALYGKRHLAQVVAIKRMQSAGKALAEIATILPTLDDTTLARVAGVAVPRRAAPAPSRESFWKRAPAAPAPEPKSVPTTNDEREQEPDPLPRARVHKIRRGARFHARAVLELAPGVTITIDPGRALTDADADAVITAARPLLAELRRRQLIATE
ncbi:MAG TPA: MerR family transcriptional regulator [Kofleriaceae bacterium]|jgi:DNA-binding transcriptional MerR regulator|nr:MerR family transcriptional regulator [Kofleriaceae bacterium]